MDEPLLDRSRERRRSSISLLDVFSIDDPVHIIGVVGMKPIWRWLKMDREDCVAILNGTLLTKIKLRRLIEYKLTRTTCT